MHLSYKLVLYKINHRIEGKFNIINNRATNDTYECNCKAGANSRCKRISAMLFKCTKQFRTVKPNSSLLHQEYIKNLYI